MFLGVASAAAPLVNSALLMKSVNSGSEVYIALLWIMCSDQEQWSSAVVPYSVRLIDSGQLSNAVILYSDPIQ